MQIAFAVLQGNILDPILFFLNINDIRASWKILKFFLFADDRNTFLIRKNIKDIYVFSIFYFLFSIFYFQFSAFYSIEYTYSIYSNHQMAECYQIKSECRKIKLSTI